MHLIYLFKKKPNYILINNKNTMKKLLEILDKVQYGNGVFIDEYQFSTINITNTDRKLVLSFINDNQQLLDHDRRYSAVDLVNFLPQVQPYEMAINNARKLMAISSEFKNKFGTQIFSVIPHGNVDVLHYQGNINFAVLKEASDLEPISKKVEIVKLKTKDLETKKRRPGRPKKK
jgi:hypothetical protein